MRTLGNIIWLVLAGFWLCLGYLLAGVLNCITIIGIPFGIQSFKLAGYALWPFGRMVVHRPDRVVAFGCLGNVIWFFLGGFWLALAHVVTGVLLCLTIIGIPLGIADFKLAGLALAPFGKQVVPIPGDGAVPPGHVRATTRARLEDVILGGICAGVRHDPRRGNRFGTNPARNESGLTPVWYQGTDDVVRPPRVPARSARGRARATAGGPGR